MKKKRLIVAGAILVIIFVFYLVCPVSVRMKLQNLDGDILYEYNYSDKGSAKILQDSKEGTIIFVDVNKVGWLGITGIRAYAVVEEKTGEVQKMSGFDDFEKQYGILIDCENWKILLSIVRPTVKDGIPDIHLFQYGITDESLKRDVLFRKEIEAGYVIAEYVSDFSVTKK